MIYDSTGSVEDGTGWYLLLLGQYRVVRVDILCYWVSMKRNWLIHDNTGRYWLVFGGDGSVWGGNGWYLVVLGQYNFLMLVIKWNEQTRKDRATQPMDQGRLR